MDAVLENEIRQRFGVLPNFFRLASAEPEITANLWGFAKFAYLDNPLPTLFKERLFVYLSRFCAVRYCVVRHFGFLVGLGYPSGDSKTLPQTIEGALPLLRRPLPKGEGMLPVFGACAAFESPIVSFPVPDSSAEQALIACATHSFLQTSDAAGAHEALRLSLGPRNIEYVNLLLAFVRMAHYWTKLHPEVEFEDDVARLLASHETLAQCILNDPAVSTEGMASQVAEDLTYIARRG